MLGGNNMGQKRIKKWSIGSIIFLCLYLIVLIKGIANILSRDKFIQIFEKLNVELPSITIFFLQYGHIFSFLIIVATLILIIKEIINKKAVSLEISAASFLILSIWHALFYITYFLPILKMEAIGKG